jgi:hypothetical protein
MDNISTHITYREATFSATAIRKGINNVPSESNLHLMQVWADAVFEPLRTGLGDRPIWLSSFFRNYELNKVKGSKTSQHMAFNGAAGDLDNDNSIEGPTNLEIFNYIREHLQFDQLIWEFGTSKKPDWVHVSYHEGHNRMQVHRSVREDDDVHYYKLI